MEYIDRRGTNSLKWDALQKRFGRPDLLAMWVADMDFAVPDFIKKAIHAYVDQPLGYYVTPDSYFEAFINWQKTHFHYNVKREWIQFSPGIVPAIHLCVHCFTQPGDAVIVSTPVYYPFLQAVDHNPGRRLIQSDLVPNTQTNTYSMDYSRFEKDIIDHDVKLYIMSNPHNPVGKVWTSAELKTILDICQKHHVLVLADEIHHDFINPSLGRTAVTAANLGDYADILISMTSASKTFNLAGLQNAFVIIENEQLRKQYQTFAKSINPEEGVGIGYVATEAAYRFGQPWLDEVKEIIYGNYRYIKDRLRIKAPDIRVFTLEGTYLLWMDFGIYCHSDQELRAFLLERCKIALDYGSWFGGKQFSTFARMNLATSPDTVKIACDRIVSSLPL